MPELIPYADFADLRLVHFVPPEAEVVDLSDWEYEDDVWVGEAIGFTEWLRLQDEPEILRSISLDLSDLSAEVSDAILRRIGLPLQRGMDQDAVDAVLGSATATTHILSDRHTAEYSVGSRFPYTVSCTFAERGLSFVTMRAPTPRRRSESR